MDAGNDGKFDTNTVSKWGETLHVCVQRLYCTVFSFEIIRDRIRIDRKKAKITDIALKVSKLKW